MIYLDYAATTPVDSEVLDIVQQTLKNQFANPSSSYQSGKHIKYQLNEARQQVKRLLNAMMYEAYFTSGATEANNWAIVSQAKMARALGLGNHIVATAVEHPSVLSVLQYLETQGFEVTYLKPINQVYTVEQFVEATREQTTGWVAMWVNNELGTQLPIKALGSVAQKYVAWFHVDAVQALGYGTVDIASIGATSVSGSAHKFYAPKGIGFLLYQSWHPRMYLTPLLHGGGQEHGLRSGTENVPYVLGMVKALELASLRTLVPIEALTQYLLSQLQEHHIEYQRNGDDNPVPYIVNLYLPTLLASQVLIHLDLAGIAISAGSACSAGSLEVSHVLQAYYPEEKERYNCSIRISLSHQTTHEEIDYFVQSLKQLQERK